MLTQERLKELFDYNPETGLFTRLQKTAVRTKVGDIITTIDKSIGYIQVSIDNKIYRVHRLAFLYMTGKFPENNVDHIDTIKTNNKWKNLREATYEQNRQNQRIAQENNKSTKVQGVYPTENSKFRACIQVKGIQYHLGVFNSTSEAHEAYLAKKRELHEFCTI